MHDFIQHRAVLDASRVSAKHPPPECGAVDVGYPGFGVGWEQQLGCAGAKVALDGPVPASAKTGRGGYGIVGKAVGIDDGQGEGGGGEDR